jgi:hypothetical protein
MEFELADGRVYNLPDDRDEAIVYLLLQIALALGADRTIISNSDGEPIRTRIVPSTGKML